jgi:hypothetical protein
MQIFAKIEIAWDFQVSLSQNAGYHCFAVGWLCHHSKTYTDYLRIWYYTIQMYPTGKPIYAEAVGLGKL